MTGQVVNITNDDINAEVALKCGDPFFEDFPTNIYNQAVYRAQRSIAMDYNIMDRIWTYTNTELLNPIPFNVSNNNGIYKIEIFRTGAVVPEAYKEIDYSKWSEVQNDTKLYYSIVYDTNSYFIYYTFPVANDVIRVYYNSHIAGETDYENDQSLPILPNKYYEEVIRRAVLYIATLGIAKFQDAKKQKYMDVIQLYRRRSDVKDKESQLEARREWVMIKPFRIF